MNKKYGKLIEGVLMFAPINLVVDDMQIINAEEADYISAGYLPIQYTIKPDDNEWQAVYTEVDGVILQSWVYEGRIHDHSNLGILEDVTVNSLSGVPAVHTLPTNAKEGDMCLYAPQNILPECGRRIYVDWEKFKEPVSEENFSDFGITAYNSQGTETLEILFGRTSTECYFNFASMVGGSGQCILNGAFANGVTDGFSLTINDEETTIYNIDDLPKYFEIPQFDTIDTSGSTGNEYLFHTEYRLMKYQGGEWVEAVEIATNRITSAGGTSTILPNTDYSFGECESLTITFTEGKKSKRNEYMFSFTSGATPTVLTLPDTVKWANELTVEANKRYEISIVDNIGLWCAVEVSE